MKLCVGRQFEVGTRVQLTSVWLDPGDLVVIVRVPSGFDPKEYCFDWGVSRPCWPTGSTWRPADVLDARLGRAFVGLQADLEELLRNREIAELPDLYSFSPEMQAYIGGRPIACSVEQASSAVEPKNNDGREVCFACGAPTKRVNTGFSYFNICRKCGK